MDPFSGRVAVITGGASGIGAAMASAFAARGARLALADLDETALRERCEELRKDGADVLGVPCDVTQRESVTAMADAVRDHFGAAHIVCNNAGIATVGQIAESPHSDWEYTMGVNFWGVVHGIEAFVPGMIEAGDGGHVVNTASMAGLVGMQWLGIYTASKFAVVGLSESLRRELAPHGIGVSALCPMVVQTNIAANSERMRPGAVARTEAAPPAPGADAMQGGVKSASEVARRVVRGIERNDPWIVTHPEQRGFLQRRAARLDAMFEAEHFDLPETGSSPGES